LTVITFLLTLALYLRGVDAINANIYFLADDRVKAGKVEGNGIAVIVSDVNGSLVVAKGFDLDGGNVKGGDSA